MAQDCHSCIGQGYLAPAAGKKLDAELLLELLDLAAECRLGDAEEFGGVGETAEFGDGREISELANVNHRLGARQAPAIGCYLHNKIA
jgi:hypothetical protein